MKKRSVCALLAIVCAASVFSRVAVATAAQGAGAAQCRAARQRVTDGLASPDPVSRRSALDAALGSKTCSLRYIALSTAFASSDPELRNAALVGDLSIARSLIVQMSASGDQKAISDRVGGHFEWFLSRYNSNDDTFLQRTNYSSREYKGNVQLYVLRPAVIVADRVSMQIDFLSLDNNALCETTLYLQPTGSTLKGQMVCPGDRGTYNLETNLLR